MKKLFFAIVLLFSAMNISFAAVFVEGELDYMSTGDFETISGYGGGLGFGITQDFNFLVRCFKGENTENLGDYNETRYDYFTIMAGVEYIPAIPVLSRFRTYWKNSVNVGISKFNWESDDPVVTKDVNEDGIIFSFKTGLQYNFTQIISPYFDIGYHRATFTNNTSLSVTGWQVDLGVRLYVFGNRDYEEGY